MDVLAWAVFLALAAVAVGTAVGFLVTMSMYRAGLSLMACFVALAGLFVLLDAGLLAAVQMMMNVGGMMVMVLFMVMAMMDPGGSRMWKMKKDMHLRGPGALSMSMPRKPPPEGDEEAKHHYMMRKDMAMSTSQLPVALTVGGLVAVLLGLLVILTAWPEVRQAPPPDAPLEVGTLLLSRYMIAFEGAAFLILAGIAAAVILGRQEDRSQEEASS